MIRRYRVRQGKKVAQYENVPTMLKKRPRWVVWKIIHKDGKDQKIPFNPKTGRYASPTNPADCASFERALAVLNRGGYEGLGFVFNGDGIVGIDLDDCRDPKTGVIASWAQKYIDALDTYWEDSPSGTGVKGYMKAATSVTGRRKKIGQGEIEIYSTDRFFAFTSKHLNGTPTQLRDCTSALNNLCTSLWKESTEAKKTGEWLHRDHDPLGDNELLDRLFSETRDGEKWRAMYEDGERVGTSESEDDRAMLLKLAYYAGSDGHGQVERLMLKSSLYREKWLSKRGNTTWLEAEIVKACSKIAEQSVNTLTPLNSLNILACIRHLDAIKAVPVEWFWDGWIPKGKVSLLTGDPGLGKTTIAIDIAARLSVGKPMPGCPKATKNASAITLVLTAEDDLADTILPRIKAAGGDPTKIKALPLVPASTVKGEVYYRLPSLPEDISSLRLAIEELGAKFVIVDPMMAYLSGKVDSHKDQDVRRALSGLKQLAEDTGAAILLVRHLNKGSSYGKAIYRGGGSIGISGAARSELLCAIDKRDSNYRVLAPNKHNLCKTPQSLRFRLEQRAGDTVAHIVWGGASSEYSADDLVSNGLQKPDLEINRAEEFLRTALAGGLRRSNEILEEAKVAGFSDTTIKRARKLLQIPHAKKIGNEWYIQLSDHLRSKTADNDTSSVDIKAKRSTPTRVRARVRVKMVNKAK